MATWVNNSFMWQAFGGGTDPARQALLIDWYCFDDEADVLGTDLPVLGTNAQVFYTEPLLDFGAAVETFTPLEDPLELEYGDDEFVIGTVLPVLTFSDVSIFFTRSEWEDTVERMLLDYELDGYYPEALVF